MSASTAPAPRTALVTGAARGIGLATARRLVADGYAVTATWHRSEPADRSDSAITWRRCDVTRPESVATVVGEARELHGGFDVVVANAALVRDRMLSRTTDDDFDAVIDVNLMGGFELVRATLADMVRRRWGRMVFVGSVGGSVGLAAQASYSASKAALVGLARSVAREVGPRGITVNVVAPGPIATELIEAMGSRRQEAFRAWTPAGRLGQPGEVAATIAFLTSEAGGAVTGAVVPVDGGFTA